MTIKQIPITELNYDPGRPPGSYEPEDLFPDMDVLIEKLLPKSQYHSSAVAIISLNQRTRNIDKKFTELVNSHKNLIKEINEGKGFPVYTPSNRKALTAKPNSLSEQKYIGEEIILQIRIVLDTLIQLIWIELNKSEFEKSLKIEVGSIGKLSNPKLKNNPIYSIFFGDDENLKKDETNFLETINQLFNSLKHSMFHTETSSLYCNDWPIISSLFAGYGDLNKGLKYHNHNAYCIIMGFQDCIKRIVTNLQTYKESVSKT